MLSVDGLRGQRGGAVAQIRFPEDDRADRLATKPMFCPKQGVFVGNRADDDGRYAFGIGKVDAGFVGRVDGLTKLLAERQVSANKHVKVCPLRHRVLRISGPRKFSTQILALQTGVEPA